MRPNLAGLQPLPLPLEVEGSVTCWAIRLNLGPEELGQCRTFLTEDELARADRFLVEPPRRRFVLCRAALRWILSSSLKVEPGAIRFSYTSQGKPSVSSPQTGPTFSFNVAHSGDLGLIVISDQHLVGVDVEAIQERGDLFEIARRFFAPSECALLAQAKGDAQMQAFYRIWTMKEAVLKGDGQGISSGLHEPDVSGAFTSPPRSCVIVPLNGQDWSVFELAPAAGFRAALAVQVTTYPKPHPRK